MGLNLKPRSYLILWLISLILYFVWNEFVILPYQSWKPESMTTMYEMSLRNPLINLGLILGAYGLLSYGLYVYTQFYQKTKGYGYENILTDQSTMRDSQKTGLMG